MRFLYYVVAAVSGVNFLRILFGTHNTFLGLLGLVIWGIVFVWSFRKYRKHGANSERAKRRRSWRDDPNNWSV